MKYKNLIVIGSSHIAKQSVEEVERTIEQKKPEIIALELDPKRFYAIIQKEKRGFSFYDIRRIGLKGWLFGLVGAWLEKKLGKIVGVMPGSEMIKAIELAKKNKLKLALIDRDIEITLKRFSIYLSWKERFRFAGDLLRGIFFRKAEIKRLGIEKLDLTKVPTKTIIKKLTAELKKRYPNVYKVLVYERNKIMAKNLAMLMQQNPDKTILAIVGAGHEEELLEFVKRGIK